MFDSENTDRFVDPDTDNLDEFNALMHGHAKPLEEKVEDPVKKEDAVTPEDENALADETEEPEDETSETEDGDDQSDEEEDTPKPKNRAQERIKELNTKFRQAEREKEELKRKLDDVLVRLDQMATPKKEEAPKEVASGEPDPDAKDENGELLYPLGDYDPKYLADVVRWNVAQARKEEQELQARSSQQAEVSRAQAALEADWNTKLEEAVETKYPDFLERNLDLSDAISGVAPELGQYLANTIMTMDNGTDVLYHLATNLDEAKAIIAMTPAKATLALGRLEARFSTEDEGLREQKPKVSKAPPPPPVNRGTSVTKAVRGDTDDLAAFEKEFYGKRK